MPLDKRCSMDAVNSNFSTLYGEGYRNPQLSAIVLNTLKGACGVRNKARMTADEIIAAGQEKSESIVFCRWVPLERIFENITSSPNVRGLTFSLPGGMRGVGTSRSASPPLSRGLAGYSDLPIPIVKCRKCGTVYNGSVGACPKCKEKSETVNLAGGMRMSTLVGADIVQDVPKKKSKANRIKEKSDAGVSHESPRRGKRRA